LDKTVGDDERMAEKPDKKNERRKLFIRTKKLMLDQDDILFIESRAKKVEIHISGAQENIEIYATMEELMEQLGESFYRCHRAYIVNMAYIAEYEKGSVTLTSGDEVYVAKKKFKTFVNAYQCYLKTGAVPGV